LSTEKSSKQKSKDEEPKSLSKHTNPHDGPVESDLLTPDYGEQEDHSPHSDQDEAVFNTAIAAAQAAPPANETVPSPDTSTTQGRSDPSSEDSIANKKARENTGGRQGSISIQSKLRSDSFRRTSTAGPLSPSATSACLPALTPDGETMNDIYRKQALRLDELERENKRLEKEAREGEARWRRGEEELEELREVFGEASVAFKVQAKKAEESQSVITELKAEIAALQRQLQQRGHSHSVSKSMRSPSIPSAGDHTSSPDSLRREVESKDSTISDMELEISRLRSELSAQNSSWEARANQISALQHNLASTQNKLRNVEGELADSKKALTRASEKAVKEGVEMTSSDTKIKALEREVVEVSAARDEMVKKVENLEKKMETMNKLHRETEARNASKLSAAELQGRESGMLKARLAAAENETLKLREERDGRKKREVSGADDEGLDELEDEERIRLERRVRELEAEIFDLKRGVWRERRQAMQSNPKSGIDGPLNKDDAGDFDEVDLSGNGPLSQNRSLRAQSSQQKHSSFSTVLNSGLAAFRGSPEYGTRPRQDSLLHELDDDSAFDEEAFALAQREEEARRMVEHVREVKRKLRDWEGWRLDLVDARKSAAGMGEIFQV
jgi:predicted  nucleic acid-binding Zn-ribbon protein